MFEEPFFPRGILPLLLLWSCSDGERAPEFHTLKRCQALPPPALYK